MKSHTKSQKHIALTLALSALAFIHVGCQEESEKSSSKFDRGTVYPHTAEEIQAGASDYVLTEGDYDNSDGLAGPGPDGIWYDSKGNMSVDICQGDYLGSDDPNQLEHVQNDPIDVGGKYTLEQVTMYGYNQNGHKCVVYNNTRAIR